MIERDGEQENESLIRRVSTAVETTCDDSHDAGETILHQVATLDLDHPSIGAGPPGLQTWVGDGVGTDLKNLHQRGNLARSFIAFSRVQLFDSFAEGPVLPSRLKDPDEPMHGRRL